MTANCDASQLRSTKTYHTHKPYRTHNYKVENLSPNLEVDK